MVRAVTPADINIMQNSNDIRRLAELMEQAVQMIAQADQKPVVLPKQETKPYPERLDADIIRDSSGRLTRIVVRPVYG